MIIHFFETFSRVGSATQTVKAFAREGLLFPSRLRNGKQVVFQPLTASTAMRTLHNPRYAGVYAYGQRLYRRTVDGKKQLRKRDPKEWLACIPDAHPGYINWEQFQHNLKVLEANGRGYQTVRASPPREGAALLQGRAVCGRCGSHMKARYADRRGQVDTWYVCSRACESCGERHCQSIAGWPVDEAIGELIAAEMTPAAVELALESGKRSKRVMTKRINSGPARSSAPRSMPSLLSGASCWSIRTTVWLPTPWSENGTTNCACWLIWRKKESALYAKTG